MQAITVKLTNLNSNMRAINKRTKKEVYCYKAVDAPISTKPWHYDALIYEYMTTTSDGSILTESDWVVFNNDVSYKIVGEKEFEKNYQILP